jgi:hypothetical protein
VVSMAAMNRLLFLCAMTGLLGGLVNSLAAQPQPTFPPVIQEAMLAAPVVKPREPIVTAVTGTSVSPVQPVSVVGQVSSAFVLNNVTVTISETVGFARDAGLLKAARQSLPTVLQALGMPAAQAQSTAKAVGDPMRFVARFAVVSERLLPVYTLVVNLTFNEPMLRSNFGGAKAAPVSATGLVSGSGDVLSNVSGSAAAVAAGPVQVWHMTVPGDDVRAVEALRAKLAGEPGTQVVYARIAAREVVFKLTTAQPLPALTAWFINVGWQAEVQAEAMALRLRPLVP